MLLTFNLVKPFQLSIKNLGTFTDIFQKEKSKNKPRCQNCGIGNTTKHDSRFSKQFRNSYQTVASYDETVNVICRYLLQHHRGQCVIYLYTFVRNR